MISPSRAHVLDINYYFFDSFSVLDSGPTDLNWDFDVSALIGQDLLVEDSGLDLAQYLNIPQPFIPLS